MLFKNRLQAGTLLVKIIQARNIAPDLILGLSRGGVVPAAVVGHALGVPVCALLVKKRSSPDNPEYALGADVLHTRANEQLRVRGKSVLIVDDGAATGKTMEAAVVWVRKKKAKRISIALPVASSEAVTLLRPMVDELICLHNDPNLQAVGAYYESFKQVTDEEVVKLLR